MNKQLIEDTKQQLNQINIELYHMSWEREFGSNILRIIVDDVGKTINMERIIQISKLLSKYFDENDPTPKDYNLEVLSAGIERELLTEEHWAASVEKLVYVVFKKAINNVKRIFGYVTMYKNGKITIKTNDEKGNEYTITIKEIKNANWAFVEEEKC